MEEQQRRELLEVARAAVAADVTGQAPPEIKSSGESPPNFSGAFVTLRKAGRLRGCIGTFHPNHPPARTVQEMAIAAVHDPRFTAIPIRPEEVEQLEIEVSLLSPMQRTDDPLSLEIGRHGIYIRRGLASGCFLPTVAIEQRWDKEEFLRQCCKGKAGLDPDAWRDPDTEVCLFTADAFIDPPRTPPSFWQHETPHGPTSPTCPDSAN